MVNMKNIENYLSDVILGKKSIDSLINFLYNVLMSDDKREYFNELEIEFLQNLFDDIDYYEENIEFRKEDTHYIGEESVREILQKALVDIQKNIHTLDIIINHENIKYEFRPTNNMEHKT